MNAPDPIAALLFGLFRAALGFAVFAPLLYGFYFLLTLPWRRRERAALLLDLLELGRRDGHTPAETLASLTTIPDRRLPARLHLLVAHLENGLSLEDALDHVPHLLPPGVRGMLQIGLRHGQPDRVFNLCRQGLLAPLGPGQSALIYLSLVFTVVALAGLPSVVLFRVVIEPKLQQIWADVSAGIAAPDWLARALSASGWSMGLSLAVTALLYLGLFTHIGGPRAWGLSGWTDRLRLLVPWQRDRLHRDFAAMLGFLLDAGVPEVVAVRESARATANLVLEQRAEDVAHRLGLGEALPQAIAQLDPAGEFRWRLENARHGSLGRTGPRFTETLRGWLGALESRAAQRESNAVQAVMCAVILSFGMSVGLHCVGVLGWLVTIVEASL
jgi:hypothetical protein